MWTELFFFREREIEATEGTGVMTVSFFLSLSIALIALKKV